ncbi:hypothetical protein [Poseidonibacter ostreae]|uniref:Uncharacterized protein n=1 Tax=Poseidonibacter ostreae TaxID=2654171 RepID=A0A6L4WX05_9BACT|nr:hypothetical protein [Poseidonibacter ostreae]KAB7891389.1 hypothetical protein GBG19_00705 [Poseidonibacter ostreae]
MTINLEKKLKKCYGYSEITAKTDIYDDDYNASEVFNNEELSLCALYEIIIHDNDKYDMQEKEENKIFTSLKKEWDKLSNQLKEEAKRIDKEISNM